VSQRYGKGYTQWVKETKLINVADIIEATLIQLTNENESDGPIV
jgi:hypothetical protein